MSFLAPGMLWLGLLLVPLAVVYLLKVRPVRKLTTTLFLWDEIFEEKKASALFQRLQDLLSLLILSIAVAMLILAMAKPVWFKSAGPRNMLIVIDNSVSMAAEKDGKTRLEQAKKQAQDIIKGFDANTNAVLVSFSDVVDTQVNLTNNHKLLSEGIDAIGQTQNQSSVAALRELLDGAGLGEFRVIVITDGNAEGLDKLEGVECVKIEAAGENVGIAAMDVVETVGDSKVKVFYRLANSGKKLKNIELTLYKDDEKNIVRVMAATVAPGLNKPEVLEFDMAQPAGRWILKIDNADSLSDDNIAYAVVPARRAVKVGVSGEAGKYFFGRCVEAFALSGGLMEFSKTPELLITQFAADAKAANQIIFQPRGKGFWGDVKGKADIDSAARVVQKAHPVMKLCDVESMEFAGVAPVDLPAGAVVLAETADKKIPLIYKVADGDKKAYVLNFDPAGSGFFLSAYFPVMLYSMADDLVGMSEPRRVTYRSGEKIATARMAEKIGFDKIASVTGNKEIAISVLSPTETLMTDYRPAGASVDIPRGYPLAWWLMVGALLLFVLESMLYHRRKVG